MALRLDAAAPDFEQRFQAYLDIGREDAEQVDHVVAEIVARVVAEGDAALLDYTNRFDRLDLTADRLRITPDEIAAHAGTIGYEVLTALGTRYARVHHGG